MMAVNELTSALRLWEGRKQFKCMGGIDAENTDVYYETEEGA